MTLREKIEVMEAFERGEEIEYEKINKQDWTLMRIEEWNFEKYNYRIKPKPKQVVIIEKWLCKSEHIELFTVEADKDYFLTIDCTKVKLLDTYEVEL